MKYDKILPERKEDICMDELKLKEALALFKFGIISPILNDVRQKQKEYFKMAAEKIYHLPGLGEKKFKWTTFKKWLRIYRREGFEGLKPKERTDAGVSRKISDEIKQKIEETVNKFQFPTVSFLYRYLNENKIIDCIFTHQTLRKFLKDNEISLIPKDKTPRKKFEKEHINELWTADFMQGPYIAEGKQKKKTYLCAIIDDCSRVIVGANFSYQESIVSLIETFKDAILTYGICKGFYCDNGKVFISGFLQLLCARLGIALIHSKPYESASRGKIERFFRTVRDCFVPKFYINSILSLEELNCEFKSWLLNEYNNKIHSGINMTPSEKYHADLENTKINYIPQDKLDYFFYRSIERTVRKDSTVIINGIYYEVPARYIGRKIEIKFSIKNPEVLYLVENEKTITQLTKLDAHFNAENIIHYKEDAENI